MIFSEGGRQPINVEFRYPWLLADDVSSNSQNNLFSTLIFLILEWLNELVVDVVANPEKLLIFITNCEKKSSNTYTYDLIKYIKAKKEVFFRV